METQAELVNVAEKFGAKGEDDVFPGAGEQPVAEVPERHTGDDGEHKVTGRQPGESFPPFFGGQISDVEHVGK